jgi:anti-sigma factor RsiW
MNCELAKNLLDGFADNELDLVNHLEIEKHLRDCPMCARRDENLRSLKAVLTDDTFYFQTPPELRKRVQAALGQETGPEQPAGRFWNWRLLALVTSFAAVLIIGLIFLQSRPSNEEMFAQEITSAHIRSMMANHLTDVPSSDHHTVKPWFDGKLDFSPPVFDLAAQGYPLVGGRLDYAGNRPIAALVYQRRQHFINLFIFPNADNSGGEKKISVRQGYNLIHWNKSEMTFWAVSDLNLNELQEFAQLVQN